VNELHEGLCKARFNLKTNELSHPVFPNMKLVGFKNELGFWLKMKYHRDSNSQWFSW